MASLYDSASLVMIPSGVKEDKLYSIKPTDGSGDFTFSRGSDIQATRVNASGLIEKAKVNNLLYSNTFTSLWAAVDSSVTGGQSGYDGSSDAWLLEKNLTGRKGVQQSITSTTGLQTISIYAKAGTLDFIQITQFGSATIYQFFDLANGVLGSASNTTLVIDANIEDVGGGWYRCSYTTNATITDVRVSPQIADLDETASSGNIYIQDTALCHGLIAQDYVETTTTAVVEGLTADLPRLDYSGGASCPSLLLEPSRSNLVTQSEYFGASLWVKTECSVTDNAATSPEGVVNAALFTNTTNSGQHKIVYDGFSVTASKTYVVSIYFKTNDAQWVRIQSGGTNLGSAFWQNFDVENGTKGDRGSSTTADTASIEAIGSSGWYRCTLNVTAPTTGTSAQIQIRVLESDSADDIPSFAGTGLSLYAYGFKFEQGSYPTSYIPTYGTAAVRGDEVAAVGSSNLISTQAFTMFFEHKALGISGTSWPYRLDMLDGSDEIEFYVNSGAGMNIYLGGNGGYIFGSSSNDGYTAGSTSKVALSYDGNRLAYFINGSLYDSTTSVSFNDVDTTLALQGSRNIANKQSLLFPTALTDAECIALTTI